MKFSVGDIFEICKEGFDFVEENKIDQFSSIIKKSSYFKYNNLKYLEIINSIKYKRNINYKIKLFFENKEITDNMWSLSPLQKEPQELYQWVSKKVLIRKLELGSIWKITWGDIAKELLKKEEI